MINHLGLTLKDFLEMGQHRVVIDNTMAPTIQENDTLLLVTVQPDQWLATEGVVALKKKEEDSYYLGRVFGSDSRCIHLSRDNSNYPGVTVNWASIDAVYRVAYVLKNPA